MSSSSITALLTGVKVSTIISSKFNFTHQYFLSKNSRKKNYFFSTSDVLRFSIYPYVPYNRKLIIY